MKRVLSILLSLMIVISLFVVPFTALAADNQESKNINSFINGIKELSREYDAEKDFEIKEDQIMPFSMGDNEDFTPSQEYTDVDFQTARLIVRADGKFDTLGAKEHISGFEDFHILQYGSPEAAISAYEQYKTMSEIKNVAPDEVVDCLQSEQHEESTAAELDNDGHLCDWSRDRTQSKRLQECFTELNVSKKKVVVGVIDTGVDYNHEFLEDRLVRTYFNSSSDGALNDEMDNEINCHGTAVSSVIVDNSPENVKVAVYRVVANDSKMSTISQICAGYLQAIEDKVDVISVSLGHSDQSGIVEACVLQAYSNEIPFFVAIGNSGTIDNYTLPANIPECITVSATDRDNTITRFSTLSVNTDISAPGEDIPVADIHNGYKVSSGTSFSAPCAAALGAILKLVYPNMTVDQMDARLKETSVDVRLYNNYESVQGSSMDNYYSLWDGVGMIQFCDALELEKLTAPEIDLKDKVYVGEKDCIITCSDENATILYTIDGTYPALENAMIYTKPFKITQRTRIRAVAYYADGGYYSDEVEATPRIQYIDDDKFFEIDKKGIITSYTGDITDLYVPEKINGITVTGFVRGAFDTVIGLTLPETVMEIPVRAFYQTQIEFICAKGALSIAGYAFRQSNLIYGEFPKVKTIDKFAFERTSQLCNVDFPNAETFDISPFNLSGLISFYGPNVKTSDRSMFEQCVRLEIVMLPQFTEFIDGGYDPFGEFYGDGRLLVAEIPLVQNLLYRSFYATAISTADLPFVTEIGFSAFYDCYNLEYINMPALLSIPKQAFSSSFYSGIKPRFFRLDSVTQIEQDAFGSYPTSRIEFSHLENAKSLPQTENCIIAMPSTFEKCNEKTVGRNYKVYGTKGTYAEKWANENGHKFIEISQETALFQDVPEEYTGDETLTVDVIGFNRTYQWYSNSVEDNQSGIPIDGATDKEFNPADYPASPYYYCVVTSTDIGYDSVEIRTGVTANKAVPADYTAYNEAVEKANAIDRNLYKDLTDLDAALAVDVSGKNITEQAEVDAQTQAILDAIDALVLKDADYTAYNEAVEKANAIDRILYKDLTDLDAALAVDVSGKNITEQAEVDAQTQAILAAINALVLKDADYTAYNEAVAKANAIERSLYKDLTDLDAVLAVDVSGKNITEQSEVDAQTQAILDAIDALEYRSADYTKVNEAKEKIPEDLSVYTDESVATLQKILNSVDYTLNITEQEKVDGYAEVILAAIEALELKPELKPVEPSTTDPEEPTQQPETTDPEEPTKPNDTDRPDIPNTGNEKSLQYSFVIFILTGLWLVAYTVKRKKHNLKFDK